MDSNVSKETFLHKFFLVPLNQEKKPISTEELLKARLLSIFDLYQQEQNITSPYQFIENRFPGKIALLEPVIDSRSLNKHKDSTLFPSQSKIIVYTSSILLVIAACLKKRPQIVAEEWSDLWNFRLKNINATSHLKLDISMQKSGWLYFYLQSKSVATCLERSLNLFSLKTATSLNSAQNELYTSVAPNFFPIQYTHARCCSLLRLGARAKIISNYDAIAGVTWLDRDNRPYCNQEAEIYLLRQLFLITDSFAKEELNWHKLGMDFSQTIMVFLAECRFLGAVSQETPEVAIARLGLIAICQYWLQRILTEKLNLPAPTDL